MCSMERGSFGRRLSTALLLGAALASSLSVVAAVNPTGVNAIKSGSDLILSFPTTNPNLYTVQTRSDLAQSWTHLQQAAIPGDGSLRMVTVSNALSGGTRFYRLLIQSPAALLLPQSLAFGILGHSCGGIKEQTYVTGFDPATGYPTGNVHLSTTCSTGGRGSRPATFTAWAGVTWDFAGNVVFSGPLSNAPAINPMFFATDALGDTIYNHGAAAYIVVPLPTAPNGITAVQSGDQFQVSWVSGGANPAAVTSSLLTATPLNSTAATLTTTVAGPATFAVISSLQPETTYQITVVSTTISGASPASTPISLTTAAASVAPSVSSGVTARWTNPDPTGTSDALLATWQAADPGNSPIDQYLVTIVGSDGAGTFTQTVPGTTLTVSFSVDYLPNWSVTVQAHNAAGWGPSSAVFTLGGL